VPQPGRRPRHHQLDRGILLLVCRGSRVMLAVGSLIATEPLWRVHALHHAGEAAGRRHRYRSPDNPFESRCAVRPNPLSHSNCSASTMQNATIGSKRCKILASRSSIPAARSSIPPKSIRFGQLPLNLRLPQLCSHPNKLVCEAPGRFPPPGARLPPPLTSSSAHRIDLAYKSSNVFTSLSQSSRLHSVE
jgi:hypothetical protein